MCLIPDIVFYLMMNLMQSGIFICLKNVIREQKDYTAAVWAKTLPVGTHRCIRQFRGGALNSP
jgi:hypothetical protein